MTGSQGVRRFGQGYWIRVVVTTLAAALVMTVVFVTLGRGTAGVVFAHAVVTSICMGGLAGLVLPPVRHRVRPLGMTIEWIVTIAGLLAVAVAGTWLACVVLGALGFDAGEPIARRFSAALGVNALLTAALGIGIVLYEGQLARVDALTLELRTKQLEHERVSKTAVEARLASLEARLHPHFLFNTLNAISALIPDNPELAERTVERLAALLRVSLDATGRGMVPLARELEMVSDYLEIEKTRLGERLTFAVDVSPALARYEIPPLAVQSLVENSIKHAIAPRPRGGTVRVTAVATDGGLAIGVWDDGPGFTAAAIRPGHGLDNLQGRLAARFGAAARLTVAPRDGGTIVTLAVPRNGTAR